MSPHARNFDGLSVPADFELGVATSSWQIEGDSAGRGVANWDEFAAIPGNVADGAGADPACDHVHRLEEDLDLLAWLGLLKKQLLLIKLLQTSKCLTTK